MSKKLKKLPFRPINDAHAIVEAVIYFEFQTGLSPIDLASLAPLQNELKAEFPQSSPVQVSHIVLDAATGLQSFSNSNNGFELKATDAAGNLEWMVQVLTPIISIHCLKYDRWDNVWSKAKMILQAIFSKLNASGNIFTGMGLKYIDRFVYEGESNAFNIMDLVREDSPYITPNSFRSDGRWHTHSGWFEKSVSDAPEVLTQVNVDAAFSDKDGNRQHITTIDTNHVIRGFSPEDIAPLSNIFGSDGLTEKLLLHLHNRNKDILAGILTAEICKRINLKVEG